MKKKLGRKKKDWRNVKHQMITTNLIEFDLMKFEKKVK